MHIQWLLLVELLNDISILFSSCGTLLLALIATMSFNHLNLENFMEEYWATFIDMGGGGGGGLWGFTLMEHGILKP